MNAHSVRCLGIADVASATRTLTARGGEVLGAWRMVRKTMSTGRSVVSACALVAACGSRSPLTVPIPTAPVDRTLVAACTKLLACPPVGIPYSGVSDCLWTNVDADYLAGVGFPRVVLSAANVDFYAYAPAACLAAAGDCAAVHACLAGGPTFDCAAAPSGACIGDMAVRCTSDGVVYAIDCAASPLSPGAACSMDADGYPACGYGPCTGAPSDACEGEVAVACQNGVLRRGACAPFDVCVSGTTGGMCVGGGAPCAEPSDRCEGDVRVTCAGGREERIDCRSGQAIQGTCSLAGSGPPGAFGVAHTLPCVPSPLLACDPEAHVDRCDGSRLVYCDGAERTTDCASLGFAACTTAHGYAACAPPG
jgi:hypothetical protein